MNNRLVVLVLGLALTACTAREGEGVPPTASVAPLVGHALCGDHVLVDFRTDDEMRAGVTAVGSDPRVRQVFTETREEALAHYKEIFESRPELVEIARVEAMPASLKLLPAPGVDVRGLATSLREEFPGAKKVDSFTRPTDDPDVPDCPESGLWPPR
ncbi:hypothetical protein [Saccharothrix sp. HUAS TT1]|uniref:hypothetical protein n=1 Tax=unclassified Saccharothrix TaxID=2593673 RepID=UPI00345C5EBC